MIMVLVLKLTVAIMAAGWRPGNITDWGAIACSSGV